MPRPKMSCPAPRPDGAAAMWTWGGAALLVAAIAATWSNSLNTPFLLDDQSAILRNDSIRRLSTAWSPPADAAGVPNRPLVNLSLAVNHALGGTSVRGYHLFNTALHAANALLVFALLRRVMRGPPAAAREPRPAAGAEHGVAGSAPTGRVPAVRPDLTALAVALLWAVHPLQTESVTGVIQRTELLGAFFILLSLWAFARGGERHQSGDGRGGRGWFALAVGACVAGALAKEIVAVVPVLALLYDRTYLAGTFGGAWRARRGAYLGLAATWLVLAAFVLHTPNRGGAAGFGLGVTSWEYLLTQCRALVLYLRLAVWPHPLVLDYGAGVVRSPADVWWQGPFVLALLGATAWALVRRPSWGFAGAWFFVILAPSSSVVPLATQTIAEHRMYLPLASVLALPVLAVGRLAGAKVLAGFTLAAGVALLAASMHRNEDYASAVRIWSHTAHHAPGNYRAHYNLGNALVAEGRAAEAVASYERARALKPELGTIHYNLGSVLAELGRVDEAIASLEEAIRRGPDRADARANLGAVLARAGRIDEAIVHYDRAAEIDPGAADLRATLGELRLMRGDAAGALREYEEAARLAPRSARVRGRLEQLRREAGR